MITILSKLIQRLKYTHRKRYIKLLNCFEFDKVEFCPRLNRNIKHRAVFIMHLLQIAVLLFYNATKVSYLH